MISIVMGYRKRPDVFNKTLESYKYFYKDLKYEIVVIDDTPDDNECQTILENSGLEFKYKAINRADHKFRNPGVVYNQAVELATYPIIHITNPENIHIGPILTHALDYIKKDNYIVYGCRTLLGSPNNIEEFLVNPDSLTDFQDGSNGWYQHTDRSNRLLHFASVMYKDLFLSIGGFSSSYENGVGFEDNDFVENVLANNIPILAFNDPYVGHQRHDRTYMIEFWHEGYNRNYNEFLRRWGHEPTTHREGW